MSYVPYIHIIKYVRTYICILYCIIIIIYVCKELLIHIRHIETCMYIIPISVGATDEI